VLLAALLAVTLCGASVVAISVAPPARAASELQGNSLNELTNRAAETETQTQTTKTRTGTKTSEGTSTSRTLILGALAAAVILLSAIGYVIVRDARRVAPAAEADIVEGRSARDAAAQLRRRRAKAKAARQARKRNR
jgi:hypothetical protein